MPDIWSEVMESVVVESLTKRFGKFVAVDSISFSVNKGEIFGFLGPNGAGKTTTIKMLCGIISPNSGRGLVAGYDINKEQDRIRENIGYMSQKFSLYEDLTIEENLSFFGSIYGLDDRELKHRIAFVLKAVEIRERKSILVKNLPQGIKQRLALGAAILHNPEILFLDEPTSGVDPIMRRAFWDLIHNFAKEGRTIFVTTHYMDEAEYCNRIALIISGKLIALDSPYNLRSGLPYRVYKITANDYLSAFQRLSHINFIMESALFGRDIHAITGKNVTSVELKNALKNAGVSGFSIQSIMPSLEDVFVLKANELKQ